MDFSYLDKPEYKDIILYDDESNFAISSKNKHFFIQEYSPFGNISHLHRHSYIQINYVKRGSGYHIINNKKIEIIKGDIFIMPPYVPHVIIPDENKNLEIVEFEFSSNFVLPEQTHNDTSESYIDFAYLEPFMVVEEELKPRFNLDEKMQNDVEAILKEVLDEYNNARPGYILIAKALLLKLLVITGRAFSSDIKGTETEAILNKYKSGVTKACDFIKDNYSKELTLDKIASEINYSKSYFCYLFKAVTGKNYVEYLNEIRILHAKELLRNTDKNITDISFEVGYKTIANFNKYFKQITGITPSKYRNLKS